MLEKIKKARDKITRIEKLSCTCSSFALQYNSGCECKKGKDLELAQEELDNLIKAIQ